MVQCYTFFLQKSLERAETPRMNDTCLKVSAYGDGKKQKDGYT